MDKIIGTLRNKISNRISHIEVSFCHNSNGHFLNKYKLSYLIRYCQYIKEQEQITLSEGVGYGVLFRIFFFYIN